MPDQTLAPIDAARAVWRDARQFQRVKKNPAFSPIAAGGESSVLLPRGETYNSLWFQCLVGGANAAEAVMVSDISYIRLTVDGDTKIDITGEEAVMLARYYQTRSGVNPIANGWLPLFFTRPWHREIVGEDGPAWGTKDVRSLELVIKIVGGGTITAVNTRRAVTDGEDMGRHLCLRRKPRAFAATGLDRISEWKRNIGDQLLAAHIKLPGASTVTDYKLTVDDVVELDLERSLWQQQVKLQERTPYAGFEHLDFTYRNRLKDAVPMIAQNMDLDITWATAAPNGYTALLEMIEGPAA